MKWHLALLPVLFLCLIILPTESTMPTEDVWQTQTLGYIGYPGTTIRRILFDDSQFSIQDYAEKADMYMNHFEQAWKIPRIHAQNPNVICLLYRNVRAVKTRYPEEYQLFVNNDWILKDAYGERVHSTDWNGNYIVDVGNPGYQQWVANWMKGYLDQYGYDGVFLDNCLPSTEIMWSTTPGPAINPRTGEEWTNQEFEDAVIDLVDTAKNTIGTKLVIGNVVWHGDRFFGWRNQYYVDLLTESKIDGLESEAWLMDRDASQWYSEEKWLRSIDFVVWLENNFLNSSRKVFTPVCQNVAPYNNQGESLPTSCTKERYVLYCFSSLLLAASRDSHYMNFGFYVDGYVSTLFDIELGNPLGGYYMINGTHVYARDFTKTKVLVNPTYQSYAMYLDGNYTTHDGKAITSPISLDAHTGMILKRATL